MRFARSNVLSPLRYESGKAERNAPAARVKSPATCRDGASPPALPPLGYAAFRAIAGKEREGAISKAQNCLRTGNQPRLYMW